MIFRQSGSTLVVHTPAKLNLFLEILGKRTDGFHELVTLMASIQRYDSLIFTEAHSGATDLQCFDAASGRIGEQADWNVPQDQSNLVYQAAELFRDVTGCKRGVRIDVAKRIPVAAGLAGGSSDAAATLAGLNRLWQIGMPVSELQNLAAHLGSDVGFFLSPTPFAVCKGRGERIEPLHMPLNYHFAIVRPSSGLSTADVYRNCRPSDSPHMPDRLVQSLRSGDLEKSGMLLFNALQQPAEILNADVTQLKQRFTEEDCLGHLMTGSGTAYFGLCRNAYHARQLAQRLRSFASGTVFTAQTGR